MAHILAGELI